jgi:hypothetical protein
MRWVLVAATLFLAAIAAALGSDTAHHVQASPTALNVPPSAFGGDTAEITFSIQDDLAADPSLRSQVDIYASAAPNVGSFDGGGTIFGPNGNADGVIQDEPPPGGTTPVEIASRHTTFAADDVNALDGNPNVHARNGTIGFACDDDTPGVVQITLVQKNTADADVMLTATLNCVKRVNNPTKMVVVVNPESVTSCPVDVLVSVQVQDITGIPLPDDTIVQFASDYGQLIPGPSAQMFGGWARVTLKLDTSTPPIVHMLAQTLGLPSKRIDILAACAGPAVTPTEVSFTLSSESVECGKTAFIGGKAVDADGRNVADGTTVKVIAANGKVDPAETTTAAGVFTVTYTAPATAGEDTVTVAVKGLFKSTKVTVTCEAAGGTGTTSAAATAAGTGAAGTTTGTGAAGTGAAATAGAAGTAGATGGTIRPPSTGDGGLKDGGNSAAGAALLALALLALTLTGGRALHRF